MNLIFRNTRANEAQILSALAMRAKAHWPYDAAFLSAVAQELQISPERASDGYLVLAELSSGENSQVIGFFGFAPPARDSAEAEQVASTSEAEMTDLFVDAKYIGQGFGKKLWFAALEFAQQKNWNSFQIVADPFAAEKFYLPMGCVQIGEIVSKIIPGRRLPLLRYTLT